jgi:hypothetical protein
VEVENSACGEQAELGEDYVRCDLHQTVHHGEGDARKDVEALIVKAQRDVPDSHGHRRQDEDHGRHVHVASLVFEPQLLDLRA